MTNTAHNVNLFCGFVDDFQAAVGNCVNADRGGANRRVGLCNALRTAHTNNLECMHFIGYKVMDAHIIEEADKKNADTIADVFLKKA